MQEEQEETSVETPPDAAFDAVSPLLRPALLERGFDGLTPVQEAVLAAEAEGRDLRISSQTGSGKTVALGLALAPSLERERTAEGPEALVIVPTRELAAQVSDELRWLYGPLRDARVSSVTGGTPLFRDDRTLARRPRVLVGTPGRLLDHVSSGKLDLSGLRELVLDEGDQMLDLGFREELEGILDATPPERRTHLVSATFPDAIRDLADRYQRDALHVEGTRLGDANQDIEHVGHLLHFRDRYAALVNLLLLGADERTLVFVERRSDTLEVATKLEGDGFSALPLSGELAQSQRERTLAAFRSGRVNVLVATDVAARGLDVPDVTHVIHTSPPIDGEAYVHRSGRTGRAGKRGRSVLLAAPSHQRRVARLLAAEGIEPEWRPVPSAEEVAAVLARRDRERLEGELGAALSEEVHPERLAQAEALLDEHPAAPLVAALLARLEPKDRARPRDIESAAPKASKRRFPRADREGERGDRGDRGDRHDRYMGGGGQGRPRARGPRTRGGDSVRFFVNWGANQGANPRRLLAAICRRGDVTGADIGSIAIHPNASTFDVDARVAERFERLAGRKDPRDPRTRIRRDRGPMRPQASRSEA